jgi:hypothetical protein
MVHACNPSYSGGIDQEDCSSKPSWANSSRETLSRKTNKQTNKQTKKPSHKRSGGVVQGPEFKPQYNNNNNNNNNKRQFIVNGC